jgi:protein required for attachment to host cells
VGHETDPRSDESERFARILARKLNDACRDGRYERLHMVVAPAFLGMLRKQLSEKTRRALVTEVSSNLATHSVADIRSHLPKRL